MDYLKAIVVASCVMMVSPTVTLADDLNDAQSGLVPIQFDKQLNPTYDRKLTKQMERDGAPETVPLSQFNNVFQDYMNNTPGSSRSDRGIQFGGPQAAQFDGSQANQLGGSPLDGNQFGSRQAHRSKRNRKSQIANNLDARGGGRKAARRAKMKAKFDTNGDGVLDDNERAQMKEWRQQRKGNRQDGGGMRKGRRGRKHQGDNQGGNNAPGFSRYSDSGFGAPDAGAGQFPSL